MRKINYIYIIEYDGCISKECYSTLEKAIDHLKSQGYFHQDLGLVFHDDCNNLAKIYDLQLV